LKSIVATSEAVNPLEYKSSKVNLLKRKSKYAKELNALRSGNGPDSRLNCKYRFLRLCNPEMAAGIVARLLLSRFSTSRLAKPYNMPEISLFSPQPDRYNCFSPARDEITPQPALFRLFPLNVSVVRPLSPDMPGGRLLIWLLLKLRVVSELSPPI